MPAAAAAVRRSMCVGEVLKPRPPFPFACLVGQLVGVHIVVPNCYLLRSALGLAPARDAHARHVARPRRLCLALRRPRWR